MKGNTMTNEEVMRRIKDLQRTRGFGTREAQRDFYALEVVAGAFLEMEKRGRGAWLTQWQDTCSQCKKEFDIPTDANCKALWNYCPICGAKMDLEDLGE